MPLRRGICLLSGLLLLSAPGCHGGKSDDRASAQQDRPKTPTTEAGISVPPAPETLQRALASLGDRALFVVVLRGEDWSEETGALLAKLGGELPELPRSPEQLLHSFAEIVELRLGPGELRGRDPGRPLLLSALEAPHHGPPGWATVAEPLLTPGHGFRHQLWIPVTNMDAARESLAAMLGEGREPWPALVEDRPGARAWRSGDGLIAALPEDDDALRVVITQFGARPSDDPAGLAKARARLDNEVTAPADTPALRQLGADAPLALWIRPWRARSTFASLGQLEARRALAMAPEDMRRVAAMRATQIVLGAELMMLDEGVEFDDWAMTLSTEGAPRVRMVGSLSPRGRELLAAAQSEAAAPLAIASDEVLGQLWLGVPADELLTRGAKTKLDGLPLDQQVRLLQECGYGCRLYLSLRAPFASTREVAQLLEGPLKASTAEGLRGLQFVELSPRAGSPRRALAVHLAERPAGEGGDLTELFGALLGAELQSAVVPQQQGAALVIGQGVDPKTVFDLEAPTQPSSTLLDASMQPEALAALAPELDRALAALGPVKLRARVGRKALSFELRLGEGEIGAQPSFADADWASPLLASAPSPGEGCLVDAILQIYPALDVLHDADASARSQVLAGPLKQAEQALSCADEDRATAATAVALRRLLVDSLVTVHLHELDYAGALALLERNCETSQDPELCALRDGVRDGPQPQLASITDAEDCLRSHYRNEYMSPGALPSLALEVDGEGLRLNRRLVPLEREAIAAAILAELPPTRLAAKELDGLPLTLVVDASMKIAELRPVFEALGALRYRRVHLAMKSGTPSEVFALPVALELPARFRPELPPLPEGFAPEETPAENRFARYAMEEPDEGPPEERSTTIRVDLDGDFAEAPGFGGYRSQTALASLDRVANEHAPASTRVELRVTPTTLWAQLSETRGELCPFEDLTLIWK